ncbi:hypothetical protein BACPLE_01075 [Phocaeicola plebeius DSM 17135]|uniref:Uncharacterized protein n=1 Tax=Phocaeicola plebeius (strain DSM 17135 / JCM 12973 / CCUG 54634 / M2) TaxID=484018 RepID=B5CWI5_PHOPM|nr:hypothetical protein BACPLE_01075 [Phocaeicola plebeius DSM 17135]
MAQRYEYFGRVFFCLLSNIVLSGKNAIFAQIIQAAYATHLYLP